MSVPQVRRLLRDFPDGMTAKQLAEHIFQNGEKQACVNKSLSSMPDAYIDRYVQAAPSGKSKFAAVWCVVEVPENCPHPEEA